MTRHPPTRRDFLALMPPAALGLAAALVAPGIAARGVACADPEAESDEGLRASMNYRVIARDAARRCATCTFYRPEDAEGCGRCDIFSGIVNVDGVCDAWSG
jgi:hypothetical protein